MGGEIGSSDRASSKRRQTGDSSVSPARELSTACIREPAAGPAGPMMADSPKRFSSDGTHVKAASPIAPTQDMTITELTHAYQQLAAQAALDTQWAGRVELAITDHALWLDRRKLAGNTLHGDVEARLSDIEKRLADGASGATTTNTTVATAGAKNDIGTTTDAADAALRTHVQSQDAAR